MRHLVAAHGGTAEAASEPGAGAAFTLRLPVTEPPDTPLPAGEPSGTEPSGDES